MEGLIYCARNSFRDQFVTFEEEPQLLLRQRSITSKYAPEPETLFDTVEIRHSIAQEFQLVQLGHPNFNNLSQQPASKLCTFFSEQDSDEMVPQLKLIRIQSQFSEGRAGSAGSFSLNITRSLFDSLLDQLQANPWVLWLISSKYDGFHHIKAHDEYADTYFFGFFHSAIVWTFSSTTACTKVILISRIASRHQDFYVLLDSYKPHLFTPYVPFMAIVLQTTLDYDERLDRYVNDIVNVEKGTNFSWVGRTMPELSFDIDALAKWSRISASVQINIINILRHHESCIRALDSIKDLHTKGVVESPNTKYKKEYDQSMTEIFEAIHILKMRADAFIPYATYLKNRAEAQINVVGQANLIRSNRLLIRQIFKIFALLTHEDSASNLKAAEASMKIAAATKLDSSAMKTIAFMTMAFLPATFLAAFFALPVLDWGHKTDIKMDGLQLYSAVAIPSTIMVFAVWALITKWEWIFYKISKVRREEKTREKNC